MAKRSLHLVPIQKLETEVQMAIRELRNQDEVRREMYTDHVIEVNEHLQWVSRLKNDRSRMVFAVVDQTRRNPIGVASLDGLDTKNRRCEWGFYLAPTARGQGTGTAIEECVLDFVFDTLGMEKLNGGVLEGNDAALRFYRRFGFEEEGFRRSEIVKDARRLGIHLLGMQKASWMRDRASWSEKFGEVLERFHVQIDWTPETSAASVIDQIEQARARNNVNWMNILRIAVEKSPVSAKEIVREIRELDQQISALTAQIEIEP